MPRATSRLPDDLARRAEHALRRAVPLGTRRAFLATELHFRHHGHIMDARAAAGRFGSPLHVITAWNPIAEERPRAVNSAANLELSALLAEQTGEVISTVGSSPSGDWREPGFAVAGLGHRLIRGIGRDFGQLAIFAIDRHGVEVMGCGYDSWSAWRPFDISNWAPEAESTSTLSDVLASELGEGIAADCTGADLRGWVLEPGVGIDCPRCNGNLVIFGCEPAWPPAADDMRRHTAVVCPAERQMLQPDELSAAHLTAIDARREFRMAQRDAALRAWSDTSYGVYCIELDLEDSAGRPAIYVGESQHLPPARFAEHLAGGVGSSRVVAEHGRRLRPDLTADIPRVRSRAASLALERWLHAVLTARGWDARGGH